MKLHTPSFAIGVATVIVIAAVLLAPYRDEITWAIKNRKQLSLLADTGSAAKDLWSILKG